MPIQPNPGLPPAVQPVGGMAIPAVMLVDAAGAEISGDVTGVSLNAQQNVQSGTTVDLGKVVAQPVWQLVSSAAITGTGTIVLEGSLDGTNWYAYATVTAATAFTAASVAAVSASLASPNAGVVLVGAAGDTLPARFLRARIATVALVGGTITVTCGGA